jgi:hypothetical protein
VPPSSSTRTQTRPPATSRRESGCRNRARRALDSPLSNFVTDPAAITDATPVFSEFAATNGQIDDQLTNDQIFDLDVYDSL